MLSLYVHVPYASFRKSYARSFGETYPVPPPATVYGMLLSLVGERLRRRHSAVRLAFAYRCKRGGEARACRSGCLPPVATTLRKLSRFKYGVGGKEGAKPDYIETVCEIEFLCWVDSSQESVSGSLVGDGNEKTLEERIKEALESPEKINRYGVLSLGLSDDAVNDLRLCSTTEGKWHRLLPSETGSIELPIWVDHTGSAWTRWQRFEFEADSAPITQPPGDAPEWNWVQIKDPRPN